jgi:hypothetical protein
MSQFQHTDQGFTKLTACAKSRTSLLLALTISPLLGELQEAESATAETICVLFIFGMMALFGIKFPSVRHSL